MDTFPAQSGTFPNIRPTFLYAQRAVAQLQALCDLPLHASKYRQAVKERKNADICARACSIPVTRYRIMHGQRGWLEQEKGLLWPICKRPKPVSKRAGWRSSIFPLFPSNFLLTPTRTLNIDPQSCWPTRPLYLHTAPVTSYGGTAPSWSSLKFVFYPSPRKKHDNAKRHVEILSTGSFIYLFFTCR